MIRFFKLGIVALFGLILIACSKRITEGGGKLPKKTDLELIQALDTLSNQKYSSFYSKINTSYSDSAQNVSFKSTVRIVADSATNMMISYASIPMVHVLITKDSVKVVNKREKCLAAEGLSFIKSKFSLDFSLKNIEELMMGLPVDFDPERTYFQTESDKGYVLCTHDKHAIKKIGKGELNEIIMYYTLSPDLSQVKSMTIVSPTDKTEITVDYTSRELIDSFLFPVLVSIKIVTPAQEIKVELEYNKTHVNQIEQIHFVIPEGYGKCE